ncbi:hypothetical protein A3K73_06320 [Candidatus Pacearchaeota archaeon RBG_13_36_9]|nr:MAG: hypothetical protein A3K73_06320 [Candidatus Pacearchaeota archaeon RBG_13_36_9]
MANINISIKEEAYQYLKMLKGRDKSFSDVIIEMKKKESDSEKLMRFFGVLKHLDWDEKEKRMKRLRESFNKRLGGIQA